MGADSSGVCEIGIVSGDLTAMSDPDGGVRSGGERRGEAFGGGADGGAESGVEAGERGRGGRRTEDGVDAIEEGFVGEFVFGEAAGCGGEMGGAEEGKEDGEDFGVTVDEDGSWVLGAAVGEREEEGVWATGAESGARCLEQLAAYI